MSNFQKLILNVEQHISTLIKDKAIVIDPSEILKSLGPLHFSKHAVLSYIMITLKDAGYEPKDNVFVNPNIPILHTDARDALVVPVKAVRSMGVKPGDHVTVFPSLYSRALIVVPNEIADHTTYTVDYSNNIRITKAQLKKLDKKNAKGYTVDARNQKLIIKAV